MAGRKRKPEALKKLEGTFRQDRAGDSISLPAGIPPKPEWATHDPIASELYNQVASQCYSMGVGTGVDSLGFALLADQLSMYLRLRALVSADGPIIETEGSNGQVNQKPHPALAQMNTSYTNIIRLMTEYGLTAAARTKVDASKPIEVDSFDSFLQG
jgi:phage terminase small subunit